MISSERLKRIREDSKLSKTKFAEKVGINPGTYFKYETGEVDSMKTSTLVKIAEAAGVTTDYLLGLSEHAMIYDKIDREDIVKIPVYGHVPAGQPIEALQVDEGYIKYDKNEITSSNPYIGLKVKGDSMYPFYMEGDIIIIEITNDFNSGEDVVVFLGYDNEATLKRIHQKEDHIELEPLNREYPVKKIYPHDNIPVRVLGKVKELRRTI